MPPPELIGFLGRHSQSGKLTLDRGDGVTLGLHLQEGQVHCALFPSVASGREGRITRSAHDEIIARGQALLPRLAKDGQQRSRRTTTRRPTARGDMLLRELRRTNTREVSARVELVRATVQRALLWTGQFRFSPGPLPAWLLDAVLNEEVWSCSATQLSLDGARYRDDSSRFSRDDLRAKLAEPDGPRNPATLNGDLTGIGLAAVLESLQSARRSGTLEVGDSRFSVDLVFNTGRVYVMRREAGDGTASFAREFLDVAPGTARWNLSEEPTGCVHEDELEEDVRGAIRDPLFALLVHDEASFRFVDGELPDDFEDPMAGTARVELRTDRFLLEAIQRLTEWDTVRRLVGHREVLHFASPERRGPLLVRADADTRELLTLIDGRRTFGALLDGASLGRLEAGRLVRGWIEDGLLSVGEPTANT